MQTMHTGDLVIASTIIRQHNGLYSLNDLHKASGNLPKHKPSEWLRNQQTQDLSAEIQKAGIPAITSRPKVGTYACKELVIAYASWINPPFHLKVLRVFLDSINPNKTIPYCDLLLRLNRMATELMGQHSQLQAHLLANQALIEEIGIDILNKFYSPDILASMSDRPAALPQRAKPVSSQEDAQLARLMRYLSNSSIFLKSQAHTNSQRKHLFEKNLFPHQSLLKAMHTTAAEFDRLIDRGKELDLLVEIDGAAHGYKGKLYAAVAGGAQ